MGRKRAAAQRDTHHPKRLLRTLESLSITTHTHTRTPGCCVNTSHSLYITLFSLFPSLPPPSFQEQGAGSHLLIGFAEETYSLRLFLPNTPWALLVLDDSPVSCSCQLSRAFTRLVIRRHRVKTAGLQGLRGRERKERWGKKCKRKTSPDLWCKVSEGGQLLPYTCLARIIFMTHTDFCY